MDIEHKFAIGDIVQLKTMPAATVTVMARTADQGWPAYDILVSDTTGRTHAGWCYERDLELRQ